MQSLNQFTVITTHLLVQDFGSDSFFLHDLQTCSFGGCAAFLQLVLPQLLQMGFLHFLQDLRWRSPCADSSLE